MKKFMFSAILCGTALLYPHTVMAADKGMLALGVGFYDPFGNDSALDVRAEWRTGYDIIHDIQPFIAMEATTDKAFYALAGVYRDFPLVPQWYVTPSFGAGFYHDGDGPDLGHTIQFRAQVEVQYEFASRNRVAAGLSRISNMGLGDRNPAAEALHLYYHMPWN